MEREDENKSPKFLEVKTINNQRGKYKFDVYQKNAITNIQIKPTSSHDPKVLEGIFKGFVHRALTLCSEKFIEPELKFLVEVFTENGYNVKSLNHIVSEMKVKKAATINANNAECLSSSEHTVTLPWIPGLSPKLRKCYKKAGYKTVFKSGASIKQLLTSKNKSTLPLNSYPGVYRINCTSESCQPYVGETKLQIRNRILQHQDGVEKNNVMKSALAFHRISCSAPIDWDNVSTLKIESRRFERKVREALEIQRHRCGPKHGGMNLDEGQYLKSSFWTPLFAFLRRSAGDNSNAT